MNLLALSFFFFSGAVGLIFEIVWTRLLGLLMGHSVFSIATVLSAFMGGLALGSYLGGRLSRRVKNPILVYGLLEGAIGIYCLFIPSIIHATEPLYQWVYQNWQTSFYTFSLFKFLISSLTLLIPTTLMGATLPLITRYLAEKREEIGWTVGKVYAINTFGAVVGSFCCGFILLPYIGIRLTILSAATINLLICLGVILKFWKATPLRQAAEPDLPEKGFPGALLKGVVIAFGLSGFASMVYQIAWTRVLSLVIGSSVYAFTLILTAFILGIALGSILFSRLIDRRRDLVAAFGFVELVIGLTALAVVPVMGKLPVYVIDIFLRFSDSFGRLKAVEFSIVFLLLLFPTTMMGVTFPLVSRICARSVEEVGRAVGNVYAVNTAGAILGSFCGGFILIPWLGIKNSIIASVIINALLAMGLLLAASGKGVRKAVPVLVALLLIVASLLMPDWNRDIMTSGTYYYHKDYQKIFLETGEKDLAAAIGSMKKILYYREGITTTVSVKKSRNGALSLQINGKTDATSEVDMRTQVLSAHLPLLLHPDPKRVCIIGLASGVTVGSALLHPLERIDCIEISPAVIEACRYFDQYNYYCLDDPRVNIIVEDGRNHIAWTDKTYDVIISEPSNPWISGISTLFTEEFFTLCRERLNRNGVMYSWFHAYKMSPENMQSVVKTFSSVFPRVTVWESVIGADYLLIGSTEHIPGLSDSRLAAAFSDPRIARDLSRVGIHSVPDLYTLFLMDMKSIPQYAAGGKLHRDDRLFIEYTAPKTMYQDTTIEQLESLQPFRQNPASSFSSAKMHMDPFFRGRQQTVRGILEMVRGRTEAAIAHFEKALSLNPGDPEALRYLAQIHFRYSSLHIKKREFEEAKKNLETAIRLDPGSMYEGRYRLALIYRMENNDGEAEKIYLEITRINPDARDAYRSLADFALQRGDRDKALHYYQEIVRIDPLFARAWYNGGCLYLEAGDMEKAIDFLSRAIEVEPDYGDALLNLGVAYAETEQYKKAFEMWEKAKQLHPGDKTIEGKIRKLRNLMESQ